MTLELHQVSAQVKTMGQTLAAQNKEKSPLLECARKLLEENSEKFAELDQRVAQAEKIQEAVRFSWLGAAPATEPIAQFAPSPAAPEKATVIASDGSQIYPDRHDIALYYLINTGAIVYQQGSGRTPDITSNPELFFADEDILNDNGQIVSTSIVNVKRDLAEIERLASLSAAYPDNGPIIALMDGQLTLRIIELPANQQEYYQQAYLEQLNRLQNYDAIIAAYIDKPHSSPVLALLHLASLPLEKIDEDALRHNQFVALTDADLFGVDEYLPAGHRSAIFNQRSKQNKIYAAAGHQINFFYLNTGSDAAPNIARVEIPGWVAKDPQKLDALHAVLLKQSAITQGYPYVLHRAHELAIVTPAEREGLDTMLAISLRRNGVTVGKSLKQANKDTLGSREAFAL